MVVRSKTKPLKRDFKTKPLELLLALPDLRLLQTCIENVVGIRLRKEDNSKKMCFMNKCSNSLVPDYISDILPPLVGEVTNYSLRNRQNLANVYTRT